MYKRMETGSSAPSLSRMLPNAARPKSSARHVPLTLLTLTAFEELPATAFRERQFSADAHWLV